MHAADHDALAVETFAAHVFDEAGGNWRTGDSVEILELGGFAALAQGTKFRIDQVLEEPGPL